MVNAYALCSSPLRTCTGVEQQREMWRSWIEKRVPWTMRPRHGPSLISRGDIRWFGFEAPDKCRPVLIFGREDVVPALTQVRNVGRSGETRSPLLLPTRLGHYDVITKRCATYGRRYLSPLNKIPRFRFRDPDLGGIAVRKVGGRVKVVTRAPESVLLPIESPQNDRRAPTESRGANAEPVPVNRVLPKKPMNQYGVELSL